MSFHLLRPVPLSEEVQLVVYSDPYLLNAVGCEIGRSYLLYEDEDDQGMVIDDERGCSDLGFDRKGVPSCTLRRGMSQTIHLPIRAPKAISLTKD